MVERIMRELGRRLKKTAVNTLEGKLGVQKNTQELILRVLSNYLDFYDYLFFASIRSAYLLSTILASSQRRFSSSFSSGGKSSEIVTGPGGTQTDCAIRMLSSPADKICN
ncbi:MAG: hypothetical protein J6C40_06215 [Lentisphaeria bacterium]|nr:hypothetical protein [Lentisphaeria bacterium]